MLRKEEGGHGEDGEISSVGGREIIKQFVAHCCAGGGRVGKGLLEPAKAAYPQKGRERGATRMGRAIVYFISAVALNRSLYDRLSYLGRRAYEYCVVVVRARRFVSVHGWGLCGARGVKERFVVGPDGNESSLIESNQISYRRCSVIK